MHHRIDFLRGPNPLDSSTSKALFYMFHVLPEWIAVSVLFSVNVRKTFGTGLFGDWRWRDETPKEKEKRLARRAKGEEKKKKGISMANMKQDGSGSLEKEKLGQDQLVTDVSGSV